MGVLCRSIATWTGCVAAMVTALEDGHALHTSTQPTLHNSAQVHGGSSQHQGGCVDEPQTQLQAVTLQYFHPVESSTITSVVESLVISTGIQMVS